jgi:hypothetical protein
MCDTYYSFFELSYRLQEPDMSKQGAAEENVMIPQKLEIIRRPESVKNLREVMASCSIRS